MSRFIDPDMLPVLEALRAAPAPDYPGMPIAEARALFDAGVAPWSALAPNIAYDDLSIAGAVGPMRARLYRPSPGRLPLIVYVHGGGWTFGSIESHENEMRYLALGSGAAVLGFDYRLGPEHPFPAPLEDVLAAIQAIEAGALNDPVDTSRLAIAGDSAGANLALGALLALKQRGEAPFRAAALFYGCFAPVFDTPSQREFGGGPFGLTGERMRWYWQNFLGGSLENAPAFAAPLTAGLNGLPPLYMLAAGLDPLRDDTLRLAEKLVEADVPFTLQAVPGVIHGFLGKAPRLPAARRALEAAGVFLARNFETNGR